MNTTFFIIFSSMCLYFCVASFTDEQLEDIYDAVLEYTQATAPVKARFCLINKREKSNHQNIKLIFNDFPDIRLSIEEFKIQMNYIKETLNISNLTDEILDEIYSTLRKDAADNSVKFYIFEKRAAKMSYIFKRDNGIKIKKIPVGSHMSREELKILIEAKISNLTDEQLEEMYKVVQKDDKRCVLKVSVEDYLRKKSIGSKHILSEQEIEYLTKSLPSDMCLSKLRFKKEIKKDEVLDEIYAGAQRYLANELVRLTECRESGMLDTNTIRRSFRNKLPSQEPSYMDIDQMTDVTELLPADIRMSKEEFKELIKKLKFTEAQLDEIYDAVLEDSVATAPVRARFCLIKKRVGMNHQLHGYQLIFNQFPDIRLSIKEFAVSMEIKEIKLPDKVLDEIYYTLREDAGKDSVKFYIIERNIERTKKDIGFKIEKIPNIHMSKEEFKELIQAKIEYLTDKDLEKLYEAVQNDDTGYVIKRLVKDYLRKKSIGSKHILSKQEIQYVTKKLPSNIPMSKEEFKESMNIQLFKLTDEQLDYTFEGIISYVDGLYTTYSSFDGKKVDKVFIESYLRDNLSKYSLTVGTLTPIIKDLSPAMTKSEFKDLASWWWF